MGNTGGAHGHGGPGDEDLLKKTTFPEMDFQLGAPHGKAIEGPKNTWTRKFGDAAKPTIVTWNNDPEALTGTIKWAHDY